MTGIVTLDEMAALPDGTIGTTAAGCPELCPACGRSLDPLDEIAELEHLEELRIRYDVAESLARIEAMDRPAPRQPPPRQPAYQPAASTIAAFWFVVQAEDPNRLSRWLAQHPLDAPQLLR